jgi:tRNA nucleotidyltransferase (CCA-adding enzyme)
VNAIAKDPDSGTLIDPFRGERDARERVLRHVSPAFVEDPVRVLRVARFAARFASLGFRIAPETIALMCQIAASGELAALVPERVWQETQRALESDSPARFFAVLRETCALREIFPEIEALFGVPQPERWHPEIDSGVHTLMVLEQATRLSADPVARFAALTHDLGKGATPSEEWPRHIAHEQRGPALVDQMCDRLRIPNAYRELAVLVARYHLNAHRATELREATLLDMLEHVDAFRRPERFEQFVLACEADARGRKGLEDRDYPQADFLRRARSAAAEVSLGPAAREGLDGLQIAQRLRQLRVEALARLRATVSPPGHGR